MKALTISLALLLTTVVAAVPAFGQQKSEPKLSEDCAHKAQRTPPRIEGEVTSVDPNSGMITVRANDGTTHQFKGSRETLSEYKVGDKLEANLRQHAPCA